MPMNLIEEALTNKGAVLWYCDRFLRLRLQNAGMRRSDLILVAARPYYGKTAFVLNIANQPVAL